jgi:phosphonate transport system substrate-binding protein
MKRLIITAIILIISVSLLGFMISRRLFKHGISINLDAWEPLKHSIGKNKQLKFAIASMCSAEHTWHSYKDLVKIIGEKIGLKGVIVLRKSYGETRQLLEQSKIDIAFVCTGTYVTSLNSRKLELLAVPEFEKDLEYRCYIITNKSSGIRKIEDLKNKAFAFTDPESNTGCIIPKWIFEKIRMPETSFRKMVYTGSHDRSLQAVANGHVDAAAVDALIYHSMINYDEDISEKIDIVWKSESFGIPPIVVNKNLANEKKKRLQKILLEFGENEREKEILRDLQITRFTEPRPESYASVIKIWQELGKISGK